MSYTLSDFLNSRIHRTHQPSPIIMLWEVALPDGSFLRFVDFMDRGQGSNPDRVTFNGHEFLSRNVVVSEFEDGADIIRGQVTVTVADPDHSGAFYLRQYSGLDDQLVNMWLTTYDHIGTVADALPYEFRIVSSVIVQSPPSITVVLGMPNLVEKSYPKLFYDRKRCFNSWQDRFVPGSLCNYPSNEFSTGTAQDYLVGASNACTERLYGWWTQQAQRAIGQYFKSNYLNSGQLIIRADTEYLKWWDAHRFGPNLFRVITGDFDVYTYITDWSSSRGQNYYGLLIQDTALAAPDPEIPPYAPTSSWLLWAFYTDGGDDQVVRVKTVVDESTAGTYYTTDDKYLRIKRVGSTFTLYTKPTFYDPGTGLELAWTQREVVTGFTEIPEMCRVGLVAMSKVQSTTRLEARFDYIRFLSGGLPTCRRTWEDCLAHANTHRFNGFRQIPDDRIKT